MAKGQIDDPIFYNLSDGTNSTVVNPWGQGDSATALRVIHAGDATASVSVVSNIATLDVQLVSGSVASVYANNPSGAGDGATALRIVQAGDFVSSVYANNPSGPGEQATALRVLVAGDSGASVSILNASLPVTKSGTWAIDNPVAQGDSATALRVIHAGDAIASIYAQNPFGPGDSATALRMIYAGDSGASVNIIAGSIANTGFNITGQTEGQGETDARTLRVVHAGDSGVSVNVITALPAGTNVIGALSANQSVNNAQVSGNTISVGDGEVGVGTLRVAHAADFAVSVFVTGANDSMLTYMARTTNPTAKTDGADVRPMADKIGRPIVTPYQVRDLVATAYITLATSAGYNTETTLIAAGAAGVFNDIIEITCTNNSTVAAVFDLRDGTAAGVVKRFVIPANATFEKLFLVPLPQTAAGTNAWTVKNAAVGTDTTGTNVTFSSIYVKNV